MKKIILLTLFSLLFSDWKNPRTSVNINSLRSSRDLSIYYSKETNEPHTGKVFYTDENDQIFLEGYLENGLKVDKWTFWDKDGNKIVGHVFDYGVPNNFSGYEFIFYYFNNNMELAYTPYVNGVREGKYKDFRQKNWEDKNYYKVDDYITEKGIYVNGKKEGKCTYYWNYGAFDGHREEFTYIDGAKEGRYTYYYTNGDRNEGTYINNLKEGSYVYYFSDGQRIEGTYINDKIDGSNIWYGINGEREQRTYVNGLREGSYIYYFSDGQRIEGTYINDKIDGPNIWYGIDGDREERTYVNGVREGSYTYYSSDTGKYKGHYEKGTYVNDYKDGPSTYYYSDGKSVECLWTNGERTCD